MKATISQSRWSIVKMRALITIIVIFITYGSLMSQCPETNPQCNAANHWIFGTNIHLEFEGDSVIQHRISGVDWLEGTTSFTKDSFLWFSFEKRAIKNNKTNTIFLPYEYYGVSTSTQGIIYIHHSEDTTYHSLVSNGYNGGGYTSLTTLSQWMLLDSNSRMPFNGGQKQQAINHQNSRDIWYVNHATTGDSIFFFLIKKEGMLECPVVTYTGNDYWLWAATQGQMKFSPDGRYLAEAANNNPFSFAVYETNLEYPRLDSLYVFSKGFGPDYSKNWPFGLEFSPSGKNVYLLAGRQDPGFPPVLYQIEIDSLQNDTPGIGNTWHSLDSFFNVYEGCLQLAPNGKIYHSIPYKNYLGVINQPDSSGLSCNYIRQGLQLDSGGIGQFGAPTFNQSYFYTPAIDFAYEESCQTNEYEFWGRDTFGATNHLWIFENGIIADTMRNKSGLFLFSETGNYKVTYIASNGNVSDTILKNLTIRPKLNPEFLGPDTFYCVGDNFTYTLSVPEDLHCIHWNGEEPYSNLFGDSVIGYENFYGHITGNRYFTVDTAGTYTARITNKAFCKAWDTVKVIEHPLPPIPTITRNGNKVEAVTSAAQYRWYFNGKPIIGKNGKNIDPDTNGYYQVQLISEFGCESLISDSFLVDFASIDIIEKIGNFKIYPNPSKGELHIQTTIENYTLEVYDMKGELILSRKNTTSFSIKSAGSYLIRICSDNKCATKIISVL